MAGIAIREVASFGSATLIWELFLLRAIELIHLLGPADLSIEPWSLENRLRFGTLDFVFAFYLQFGLGPV